VTIAIDSRPVMSGRPVPPAGMKVRIEVPREQPAAEPRPSEAFAWIPPKRRPPPRRKHGKVHTIVVAVLAAISTVGFLASMAPKDGTTMAVAR
jgi:hypothetical protein